MNPVSGVANGSSLMIAMLVSELDRRGAISKAEFAELLVATADAAELTAPAHARGQSRVDLDLMRQVAGHLTEARPPWLPVVIQGGRED